MTSLPPPPPPPRSESTAKTRASILSVLHANCAKPLDLLRVGAQHIPTELLERVVHETRADGWSAHGPEHGHRVRPPFPGL